MPTSTGWLYVLLGPMKPVPGPHGAPDHGLRHACIIWLLRSRVLERQVGCVQAAPLFKAGRVLSRGYGVSPCHIPGRVSDPGLHGLRGLYSEVKVVTMLIPDCTWGKDRPVDL